MLFMASLSVIGCFCSVSDELLDRLHHYELVVPNMVDEEGKHLTYDVTHDSPHLKRKRRDTSNLYTSEKEDENFDGSENLLPDRTVFYKLRAFGQDFQFHLTLNPDLVSPTYSVEYWDDSGVESSHHLLKDCHYVGHLGQGQLVQSRVALSNCMGLVSTLR